MRDVLRTYAPSSGQFDEIHDDTGALRPHWAAFADATGAMGPAELDAAGRRVARQLHENGVTYNVQTAHSPVRAWTLDVLPNIVTAAEWQVLAAGLRQRARLLEAVMADIYGPRRLLAEGIVPPPVVFGHRGFLRAAHGVRPPGGTYLHLVAFDLGRGPDGRWRLLATRAQAPSGAGYALENRLTISRIFPDAFRDQHVQRLAPFFRTLQQTLLSQAPAAGSAPHVVLLTPGLYNETYFEHAYLSRYLGFTLAEGADLTVRDDCVFLKTVGDLRRVDVILRRVDDDFCDPLELRAESALGVPGLVQAWRSGHVLVANAFGTGIVESPALAAFLPAICLELLGEPLALPSPESWWCGDPTPIELLRARLPHGVIKPALDGAGGEPVFGGQLDEAGREAWLDRLRTWPERHVLEEYLPLAHVPVWTERGVESRKLMMRAFLVSDGQGDFRVLPGGLSRIGGTDREVVSGRRGGGSKDTWILSDAPVERFSLLPGRLRASDVRRHARAVSSRSAEHLFWLGRYAERSENAARLLRALLSRLPQGDASVSPASPPIAGVCRRLELVPADMEPATASAHDCERALIAGIVSADATHSLAYNVEETLRVASTVRDRLSADNWRILNRLSETLGVRAGSDIALADALELVDRAIFSLVAVGGLEMAHMTRDEGWRFMSLGRHLERVLYVLATAGEVARSDMTEDPGLLEWLLDLSDSIITYRARYMGQAEWIAVADLLLFDRLNPRSAAFQLAKLVKHIPQLPGGDAEDLQSCIGRLAPPSDGLWEPSVIVEHVTATERMVLHLSDLLTLRFFSHVYEPAHATLL
jgi:uncharacterized circularly permuted ATP-grasp superfamily protein/uncharacterized alpha-E superfamily protein